MPLITTAVLLFDSRLHSTTDPPPRDRLWYDHYFFHPSYGQAGYWGTQTDNQRIFGGQVFDWLSSGGSLPDLAVSRSCPDCGDRWTTIEFDPRHKSARPFREHPHGFLRPFND